MRRYRGADKPPGRTLSPPPYSRNSTSRTNPGSTRNSTGGNIPRQVLSGMTTPVSDNELLMMRGITTSAPFLDPRTKKPMIPPAGRTVPKLKMADLTSSLAPLVESQMAQQQQKSPISVSDKRIAEALKEVTSAKDMLESFDDAIKVPDMRAINSRVAQLRKGIGPQSNHSPKASSSSRLGNMTSSKTKAVPSDSRKLNASKVSPKNEEQNIRKLMGQLKDKYLDDMESQLGLAIERRPRAFLHGEASMGDGIQDQSGVDPMFEVGIPRPSTDATEIASRIDKVVREWATESQKLSTVMKIPASSAKQHQSISGMSKTNNSPSALAKTVNDANGNSIDNDGRNPSNATPRASNVAPGRNKNLAKISTAFRKSLDPISKRDVRELICIPEDNHVEKLEQEHEERRRAHESVFKNAIITNNPSSAKGKDNITQKKSERKMARAVERSNKRPPKNNSDDESSSESTVVEQNRTKSSLVTSNSKQRPFAKSLAKKDEDEVYNIIKEQMEYETSGGPPKLTKSRNPGDGARNASMKSALLRSDAAGKALLKYSDSHKKLQSVVDSFTEKVVDVGPKNRPGPAGQTEDTDQSEDDNKGKAPLGLPVSSKVSISTVNSRRRNATEASSTLTRSMKTIDRASSVAQRLGTLMSRVALRNEAYDYEKQQEARQKSISLSTDDNNDDSLAPPGATRNSINLLSNQPQYENYRPNPYEGPLMSSNSEHERPSVPPGISKLDSSQFGKYVEEMKKVAEKAAASFEKFKERQVKNGSDLGSLTFSEDEEGLSDPEHGYQGSGEAAAIAVAAAEIAAIQEQEKNRKTVLQRAGQAQQRRKVTQRSTPRKQGNMFDAGTSPREPETAELLSQINRNFGSDAMNNNNSEPAQFKFIPDMSYTDQLMLQKLRKLKEKEGWQNSLLSEQFEAENETAVGDVPDKAEIESMIKRSTNMKLPRETERASMGPISLNALLRSRLNNANK